MKKIMLSVAPVSASDMFNDAHAISQDVIACYHAGASMVHLHCRDAHGRLTPDLSHLKATVDLIRKACPIVIEVSTGGVSDLSIQERCTPCFPEWIECNSLNVGSVNLGDAVYRNPIADVRYCVDQILKNGKVPEIEVFEPGMMNTVRELCKEYAFSYPLLFAIVLGHQGAMPASTGALDLMLDALRLFFPDQRQVLWGITQAHRENWSLIEYAIQKGACSVRIGFEDSNCLCGGVQATNNAVMVAELARRIRALGAELATPDEARHMLKLSSLD